MTDTDPRVARTGGEAPPAGGRLQAPAPRRFRAPAWYTRWEALVLSAGSLAVFLGVWEFVARGEIVNPVFISYPSAIWSRFIQMFFIDQDIYFHLAASGRIWATGFVLGVLIGVVLGFVAGRSRRFRFAAEPYLIALYSTPTVAFLPLLILWFGIGDAPKVLLVCVGTMFPVLINTQAGVLNVSPALLETARSFRANRWQILRKVALPSSIPYILAGVRLGIGRALIMVFVAELIISNRGIGYIVANAGVSFQADRLFVGILCLTITGVTLTKLVSWIEERKFSYGRDR